MRIGDKKQSREILKNSNFDPEGTMNEVDSREHENVEKINSLKKKQLTL